MATIMYRIGAGNIESGNFNTVGELASAVLETNSYTAFVRGESQAEAQPASASQALNDGDMVRLTVNKVGA